MDRAHGLHDLFIRAAEQFPDNVAVVEPAEGSIRYGELARLSDRLSDYLRMRGVCRGDRVGIFMRKSIDAVAAIYGILKAGATYVPVDTSAPAARSAYTMHNCGVKVLVMEQRFEAPFRSEAKRLGTVPEIFLVGGTGGGRYLQRALDQADALQSAPPATTAAGNDLAYILYTSGSTGKPKGVMLSHDNAVSFLDWCSEVFQPMTSDRFSSHAPFHFDLSVLDIHLALKHGATLVLIPEETGKDPMRLAPLIAEQRITCWYSAPSILSLLAQYGSLRTRDYSALRLILFAGEVFPVRHLRTLTELLPRPRYFNLYGPTETNVCTFYQVPLPIPEDRTSPFPIGRICSHLKGKVVDELGREVARGTEGELVISGRAVMQGYWSLPQQSADAFLSNDDKTQWYKTGDIVVELPDGNYSYIGRRDRMVKKRGYRIELGEIEAGLYRHPLIKETAVVAVADSDAGVKIKAFLSCQDGARPSTIELKRFCSQNLPLYMIPDHFVWCESLPKTSTDKIDYQRLNEIN
ncbi:MAG TPA: amino acid adenylation domain-containing protein [Bryobacteraceae bacterium]